MLSDGKTTVVLCALDRCRIHNESYGLFRRRIAAAAGIPESNVAVQCLHQHDAPVADTGAQTLLEREPGAARHLDLAYLEKAAEDVARAARAALPKLRPFTHVGRGKAKVEKVASTRRIPTGDGKIRVRSSMTKDPSLHAAPEGKIDPWIRTFSRRGSARPWRTPGGIESRSWPGRWPRSGSRPSRSFERRSSGSRWPIPRSTPPRG